MDSSKPESGSDRIAALRSLDILDTPRERDFDEIVAFVTQLCDVPTALISLVDAHRQWFKAAAGFDGDETPLDRSICFHALQQDSFLEIPDTALDQRTQNNPLCRGPNPVRFYAGALLRLDNGLAIGSLCVLDRKPRELTRAQRETMILLARQVVRQIELRQALLAQARLRGEIDHRVKNSLQMVASYLRIQRRGAGSEAQDVLRQAEQQVSAIVALHGALNDAGSNGYMDLRPYLVRIAELIGRTLPGNIRIETEFDSAMCDGDRAAAAGLIVNEFVANSVKHAFPDDRAGVIRLRGTLAEDGYLLDLSDDGVGMTPGRGGGFGLSFIDAAARQLQAELSRPEGAHGTALMVRFPAAPPSSRVESVAEAG